MTNAFNKRMYLQVTAKEIFEAVRIITDPHEVYDCGYTRVTIGRPNSSNYENTSKSVKATLTNCILQLECMKQES